MVNHDHRFWLNGDEEHQQIAERFERNVEITHPDFYTCDVLPESSNHCPFCATKVKYYEYTGPKV